MNAIQDYLTERMPWNVSSLYINPNKFHSANSQQIDPDSFSIMCNTFNYVSPVSQFIASISFHYPLVAALGTSASVIYELMLRFVCLDPPPVDKTLFSLPYEKEVNQIAVQVITNLANYKWGSTLKVASAVLSAINIHSILEHAAIRNARIRASAFERTIISGSLEDLQKLTQTPVDVNCFCCGHNHWARPIHIVAYRGAVEQAKILKQAGANLNLPDGTIDKNSPLLIAILKMNQPLIEWFLEQKETDLDYPNAKGTTAFDSLLESDKIDLALKMVEFGSDSKKSKILNSYYAKAASYGDVEALEKLSHIVNINHRSEYTGQNTPLVLALFNRQFQAAALILEKGAQVNISGPCCYPIHLAAITGNLKIFKEIYKRDKTLINSMKNGLAPIHWAILSGAKDIVSFLVQEGAKINFVGSSPTPLMAPILQAMLIVEKPFINSNIKSIMPNNGEVSQKTREEIRDLLVSKEPQRAQELKLLANNLNDFTFEKVFQNFSLLITQSNKNTM